MSRVYAVIKVVSCATNVCNEKRTSVQGRAKWIGKCELKCADVSENQDDVGPCRRLVGNSFTWLWLYRADGLCLGTRFTLTCYTSHQMQRQSEPLFNCTVTLLAGVSPTSSCEGGIVEELRAFVSELRAVAKEMSAIAKDLFALRGKAAKCPARCQDSSPLTA